MCCTRKPLRVLKKKPNIIKGLKYLRETQKKTQFTAKDLQDDPMKGGKTFQCRAEEQH